MWKINEVLSFDDVRYRILHIHQSEIIWINIDENKGIPKLVLHLQLIEWMDNNIANGI
jgi:protein tyrosine phosphatase